MKVHTLSVCKPLIVPLIVVIIAGCASPGVKKQDAAFLTSLRNNGKTTIVNYEWSHTRTSAAGRGGGILYDQMAIAEETAKARVIPRKYEQHLNDRCIAAIEQVLIAGKEFAYIERSTLGLSGPGPDRSNVTELYMGLKDKNGITTPLRVNLNFKVKYGWNKRVYLFVNWEMLSPKGESMVKVNTIALADTGVEMFPNTLDPRYEATFIELAARNATQFLNMLRK